MGQESRGAQTWHLIRKQPRQIKTRLFESVSVRIPHSPGITSRRGWRNEKNISDLWVGDTRNRTEFLEEIMPHLKVLIRSRNNLLGLL